MVTEVGGGRLAFEEKGLSWINPQEPLPLDATVATEDGEDASSIVDKQTDGMRVTRRRNVSWRGVGFSEGAGAIQYCVKLPFDVPRPQLLDHAKHLPIPDRLRGAKERQENVRVFPGTLGKGAAAMGAGRRGGR